MTAQVRWQDVEPPPGEPGVRDWGHLAHETARKHLEACAEAMDAEEEMRHDIQSPACAPYCGCTDCDMRETLFAAWPVIEAAIRSGDFDSPAATPAAAGDSTP